MFSLGRGKFRVFRLASQEDGGNIIYGISDEESRLNLNSASANQFTNLSGMTSDIVGAIMVWRSAPSQDRLLKGSKFGLLYVTPSAVSGP